MRRQAIDVPDLAGAAAQEQIRTTLESLIGVDEAVVDLDRRRVVITYDEGWIGEAGLMGVIQDAGFTVPAAPVRPDHHTS